MKRSDEFNDDGMTDEQIEKESASENAAWRYFAFAAIGLALASYIQSPYQDALKMLAWTTIFFGIVLTHSWPFIIDTVARGVIFVIFVLHFVVVSLTYWRIPHHGFIAIGLIIAAECGASMLPIGWLDVRSQKLRAGRER